MGVNFTNEDSKFKALTSLTILHNNVRFDMTILGKALVINQSFVQNSSEDYEFIVSNVSKTPRKQLAILTCMDTRLVDFLEPALGIKREDAVIIKNAGNCVTSIFETTIRSLVLAIYELGVTEIMVIGHKDCGVAILPLQPSLLR